MDKNILIKPHGGKLLPLILDSNIKESTDLEKLKTLKRIFLKAKEISDINMLGAGLYSPLEGFMGKKDYENVINDMHLDNSILWPIPINMAITRDESSKYHEGQEVLLCNPDTDEIVALMKIEEMYNYDKEEEAFNVFGTKDTNHPGVKKIFEQGEIYIGGKVKVINCREFQEFEYFSTPEETRRIFSDKGWKTIVAFQTRNPIHRSHEYLLKVVLEMYEGLFINPIVGKLKEGDIPAYIRMQCYETLINNYFVKDRVVLKVYPMEMRYAGPREAILHAIIRQNYGCTHIIIGRDHAGVGKYYGPFDAQDIFDSIPIGDLLIKPLKMDWTFWCEKCKSIASSKTCPHPDRDHKMISGTELRDILSKGEYPPNYITRKEISDILINYYKKSKQEKGF